MSLTLLSLLVPEAHAWTHSAANLATQLEIRLVMSSAPATNNFTRELTFTDGTSEKRISVPFTYDSYLHYSGTITDTAATGEEMDQLNEMVPLGNRAFWDTMTFNNYGGSTTLNVASMEVWVTYANLNSEHIKEMMIGYASNFTLGAPTGSVALSQSTGRRNFFRDFMGDADEVWNEAADMSLTDFNNLPQALREMVYDLGKSGSDDGTGNPQYGDGASLCSETISWYYYEFGEHITGENFRDISFHGDMADAFDVTGRLYCYAPASDTWIRWVSGFPGHFESYVPQPGDYLDRDWSDPNGHAMMFVDWDPVNGIATVLDGPTIALREVDVYTKEHAGSNDFCVGRIPSND